MSSGNNFEKRLKSAASASLAVALTFAMPGAAFAEGACDANQGDLKIALQAFKEAVMNADTSARDGFEQATTTNYRDAFFDNLDDMNEGASQAYNFVSEYYDIEENITELALSKAQKSLPPTVTLTMENAEELAQAAADEDNSKIDLAELRCSQDIKNGVLGTALASLEDESVSDTFYSAHNKVCKLVQVLAMLQKKHEQLQEIRENGYPLFHLHVKDKKKFAGKYQRTIQFKVDLRMYPEYPDDLMNANGEDQQILLGQIEGMRLSYNTYFKWSDNNWNTINLYQYILDDMNDSLHCVDLIKISNNAKAALCVGLVKIDEKNEEIVLDTAARFKFEGDTKSIGFGHVTVPMPFGYLADVSDMKESAMQEVKSIISEELTDAIEDMIEASGLADEVKDQCNL